MSRIDRVNELAGPPKGPQGAGRDQANLDNWASRAEKNSATAPRASKGETETGARASAKRDTNSDGGSSYMRGVRRQS